MNAPSNETGTVHMGMIGRKPGGRRHHDQTRITASNRVCLIAFIEAPMGSVVSSDVVVQVRRKRSFAATRGRLTFWPSRRVGPGAR